MIKGECCTVCDTEILWSNSLHFCQRGAAAHVLGGVTKRMQPCPTRLEKWMTYPAVKWSKIRCMRWMLQEEGRNWWGCSLLISEYFTQCWNWGQDKLAVDSFGFITSPLKTDLRIGLWEIIVSRRVRLSIIIVYFSELVVFIFSKEKEEEKKHVWEVCYLFIFYISTFLHFYRQYFIKILTGILSPKMLLRLSCYWKNQFHRLIVFKSKPRTIVFYLPFHISNNTTSQFLVEIPVLKCTWN